MQDSPDAKKPCKGILKNSSSFDKPSASYRKSAKFDEINVMQTYHPHDKDYGHMKIDEPKTPYNYVIPDLEHADQLDANLLAEKLRIAANTQSPSFGADECSDEEFSETAEEKVRRLEFERRRKAHYNEFEAVRIARKLIQEELADDDEEEVTIDDELSLKTKPESGADEQRSEQLSGEQSGLEENQQKSSLRGEEEDDSDRGEPEMDIDAPLPPTHACAGRE